MGFEAGDAPDPIAVRAWNQMDARIDWSAIPVLIVLYGITDVDTFLAELMAIQKYMRLSRG